MARRAHIDHEALRAAYLEHGSQARAARALGITERTLNRRRKTDAGLDRVLAAAREEFLARRRASKPHGTRARYVNCTSGPDGGKCEDCKRANTEAARRNREARLETPFHLIPHGVHGYANYGCRCPMCCFEHSEAMAAYRARRAEGRAA